VLYWQFLRTVKPLETDEEYAETCRLAEEFQAGLGKKLQRYLWLKSWYVLFSINQNFPSVSCMRFMHI
jgi:hypothetical protein